MNNPSTKGNYSQDRFLDAVIARMGLGNDASLGRILKIPPSRISRVRHGRTPVNASLLIAMHESSGLSIKELRELLGDRRAKFRISEISFLPVSKKAERANRQLLD